MLEKMDAFFEARLDGYDEHMKTEIAFAGEFYPFTAGLLPTGAHSRILDLGCGTGLELEDYFPLCPTARVTGIDLSRGMLEALRKKFPEKELDLICDSYFDVPLGEGIYDAAVSVESLHHFTMEEKIPLYRKLRKSLKDGGYFVLTDYFAASEKEENDYRRMFTAMMTEQGLGDTGWYHFDTPLTTAHEVEALKAAGFSRVEILKNWEATYTIKAIR